MQSTDPVAQMCAEMGLPPPKTLMRQARELVTGGPTPTPKQRPAWPPGFASQLGAMIEADGRKTAAGSAAERSRKATEARQQAADAGAGWGKGTAVRDPQLDPVGAATARPARRAAAAPKLPARKPVYTFRGDSVAFRAWTLLSAGLRLRVRDVAHALDVSDADLRQAILVPQRRKILVLDAGHLMRGPVVPGLPLAAREGAAR